MVMPKPINLTAAQMKLILSAEWQCDTSLGGDWCPECLRRDCEGHVGGCQHGAAFSTLSRLMLAAVGDNEDGWGYA
jgi:hypothetical protein